VTAALQQLELELGVPLFRRLPSGVELTVEGSRFLTHARNVMAAVSAARRARLSETTALKGAIQVGVTYTVGGYFLPRHYTRFARNYPDIRVELNELPRAAIENGLKDGALDIAVMLVSNPQDREFIASVARAGDSGCRWSTRCFTPTASTSRMSPTRLTSCSRWTRRIRRRRDTGRRAASIPK
jgi:DNA-binding transcriptional LysR family regulator